MRSLLLLEDEERVAGFIRRGLEAENYRVTLVADGHTAVSYGLSGEYDLIILDIMVPGLDGLDVCRSLRESGISTPILMLSARDSNEDVVQGLGIGADDYLAKPFAFEVLLARLDALFRRRDLPIAQSQQSVLTVGPLSVDLSAREVRLDPNTLVELTKTEFDVLALLASKPGVVFSREKILSGVWSANKDPMTNVVDVYITRLRRKLAGVKIVAVRGSGYKLLGEEPTAMADAR